MCRYYYLLVSLTVTLLALFVSPVTALSDNITISIDNTTSSNHNETIDAASSARSLPLEKSLWAALMENCKHPTMLCVERTIYTYMQNTLDHAKNVDLTSFLKFTKNYNDYGKMYRYYNDSTLIVEEDYDNPLSSVEKMSRAFHDKTVKFLMTHDTELELPETVFEGTTLKLSPRAFADDGILVKLDFIPREIAHGMVEARHFKKIKKYITDKLLYALLAILLVIKLLAVKFLFLMPMMIGMAAAKKLLIKVLLFLFPALHHVFNLCQYVPHGTKFHHHKHQIKHLHHVPHFPHHHIPPPHKHKFRPPGHHHHESVEVIAPHAGGPPSLHHFNKHEPPHKPFYHPHEQDLGYFSDGPSLSHHFITHREDPNNAQWGEGQATKSSNNRPLTPTEMEQSLQAAEREAFLKARLQKEKLRIQEENALLQAQLRQAIKAQEKLKLQHAAFAVGATRDNVIAPASSPTNQYVQTPQTPSKQGQWYSVQQQSYDVFYTPILDKIDKILTGLGFSDEPCRERLICSMYKNPAKFSPHSNLLSAELSRDSSELQKPTTSNAAVIRFYRYVQAARDGQDRRDCLRLYTACAINTEQK